MPHLHFIQGLYYPFFVCPIIALFISLVTSVLKYCENVRRHLFIKIVDHQDHSKPKSWCTNQQVCAKDVIHIEWRVFCIHMTSISPN